MITVRVSITPTCESRYRWLAQARWLAAAFWAHVAFYAISMTILFVDDIDIEVEKERWPEW